MAVLGKKLMEAFKSQKQCDVKIKLRDGTIIEAHRVVLVLGAKWFEARLRGEWDKKSDLIKCTEHSTHNTQTMINFLYSNEIQITMESVEEIYQIADYYDILDLTHQCFQYLKDNIDEDVFKILLIAHDNDIEEIKTQCLQFLDKNMEQTLILRAEASIPTNIPLQLIIDIIRRNSICVHEELLFNHILLWMSNFQEDDKANIWQQIIPHVRFGRMSVDFFLEHLANNSIIDKDLSLKVLIFLSSVESQDIPDHCIQERCLTTQKDILIRRFTEHSHNSTWPVENTINGDRISFSLNLENLRLRGVYVFGRSEGFMSVSILLFDGDSLIAKTQIKQRSAIEIPVIFPKPIALNRDIIYTLVVHMSGGHTYYGIGGVSSANRQMSGQRNLRITFHDPVCGKTTIQKGQILGIILHE